MQMRVARIPLLRTSGVCVRANLLNSSLLGLAQWL